MVLGILLLMMLVECKPGTAKCRNSSNLLLDLVAV
jgi:hypothetical protein